MQLSQWVYAKVARLEAPDDLDGGGVEVACAGLFCRLDDDRVDHSGHDGAPPLHRFTLPARADLEPYIHHARERRARGCSCRLPASARGCGVPSSLLRGLGRAPRRDRGDEGMPVRHAGRTNAGSAAARADQRYLRRVDWHLPASLEEHNDALAEVFMPEERSVEDARNVGIAGCY